MMDDAVARGTFLSDPKAARPGYLVLFNWTRDKNPNEIFPAHISIVESLDPVGDKPLHTVEFNTTIPSGPYEGTRNAVAQKDRQLIFVVGYVKTYVTP